MTQRRNTKSRLPTDATDTVDDTAMLRLDLLRTQADQVFADAVDAWRVITEALRSDDAAAQATVDAFEREMAERVAVGDEDSSELAVVPVPGPGGASISIADLLGDPVRPDASQASVGGAELPDLELPVG